MCLYVYKYIHMSYVYMIIHIYKVDSCKYINLIPLPHGLSDHFLRLVPLWSPPSKRMIYMWRHRMIQFMGKKSSGATAELMTGGPKKLQTKLGLGPKWISCGSQMNLPGWWFWVDLPNQRSWDSSVLDHWEHLEVSWNGDIQKCMVFNRNLKFLLELMIYGYPHFRKPPYKTWVK